MVSQKPGQLSIRHRSRTSICSPRSCPPPTAQRQRHVTPPAGSCGSCQKGWSHQTMVSEVQALTTSKTAKTQQLGHVSGIIWDFCILKTIFAEEKLYSTKKHKEKKKNIKRKFSYTGNKKPSRSI